MLVQESLNEASLEIQKTITHLKELSYSSKENIKKEKYIKSYKAEFALQNELKYLSKYLLNHREVCRKEAVENNEEISKQWLKLKIRQIEEEIEQSLDD